MPAGIGTGDEKTTRHKIQRDCVSLGAAGVREMDSSTEGRGQVEARAGRKVGMRRRAWRDCGGACRRI